jgi:hypothetical protein
MVFQPRPNAPKETTPTMMPDNRREYN